MNRFNFFVLRASTAVVLLGLALPAYAQSSTSAAGINNLGNYLLQIVTFIDVYVVPLIFALAFIVFIWGVYSSFIAGATSEEKRQEGQKLVMYGLIGFFLMFSVWGLVNLLVGTFHFNSSTRPGLPTFNAPGSGSTNTGGGTPNPFQTTSTSKNVGDTCSSTPECGSGMECISGTCHPFGDIVAPPASGGGSSFGPNDCRGGITCAPHTICQSSGANAGKCVDEVAGLH